MLRPFNEKITLKRTKIDSTEHLTSTTHLNDTNACVYLQCLRRLVIQVTRNYRTLGRSRKILYIRLIISNSLIRAHVGLDTVDSSHCRNSRKLRHKCIDIFFINELQVDETYLYFLLDVRQLARTHARMHTHIFRHPQFKSLRGRRFLSAIVKNPDASNWSFAALSQVLMFCARRHDRSDTVQKC